MRCEVCWRKAPVASRLGVCIDCIRDTPEMSLPIALRAHHESRTAAGLPPSPPNADEGAPCGLCSNACRIPEEGIGYCGMHSSRGGKIVSLAGMPGRGVVEWYHDPLPTNCVAGRFCPNRRRFGWKNLAVFYGACNHDCFFCQNSGYRDMTTSLQPQRTADELADAVDFKTGCVCFFGGDPTPQLPHAIRSAELILERRNNVRICWETNGSMSHPLLKRIGELSLRSDGVVKFDLKAWNESLYQALCGVSNRWTYENFRKLYEMGVKVTASTLLVPGYVDEQEVSSIAEFIASQSPEIHYSLLAFHPQFLMDDLRPTSRAQAEACLSAASEAGLQNVRIGNRHLLWG